MTTKANGTGDAGMTFEAFAAAYLAAFTKMMSYSLTQVGSDLYCDQLAALADAYPEWAAQVEEAR